MDETDERPGHVLKTWPEPFQATLDGRKNYELRKNDRDFRVGDALILNEWDPTTGVFTGRWIVVEITYMTPGGTWGLPDDLCILSIQRR